MAKITDAEFTVSVKYPNILFWLNVPSYLFVWPAIVPLWCLKIKGPK